MPKGRYKRKPIYNRWLEKVEICIHGFSCRNCCWEWIGARASEYGTITINGKATRAHRIGWELINETQLSDDVIIRHSCNFGLCQQPGHWTPGTKVENTSDMIFAGRGSLGSFSITDSVAKEICELYIAGGWTQQTLGFKFGTSAWTVSRIVRKLGPFAKRN